jgi:hypothetical protein
MPVWPRKWPFPAICTSNPYTEYPHPYKTSRNAVSGVSGVHAMDFAKEWKYYRALALWTFIISVVANLTIIARNVAAFCLAVFGD